VDGAVVPTDIALISVVVVCLNIGVNIVSIPLRVAATLGSFIQLVPS
jgi:hypothetical protein